MPSVQTVLRTKPVDSALNAYLEAENADTDEGENRITLTRDGEDEWLDFVPAAVLSMAMSQKFCAVACEDGNLRVYSPAGRQ